MTVSEEGIRYITDSSTSNITFPAPSGIQAGDMLVGFFTCDTAQTNEPVLGSGWELVSSHSTSSNVLIVGKKTASSTDSGVDLVAGTLDTVANYAIGSCVALRNTDLLQYQFMNTSIVNQDPAEQQIDAFADSLELDGAYNLFVASCTGPSGALTSAWVSDGDHDELMRVTTGNSVGLVLGGKPRTSYYPSSGSVFYTYMPTASNAWADVVRPVVNYGWNSVSTLPPFDRGGDYFLYTDDHPSGPDGVSIELSIKPTGYSDWHSSVNPDDVIIAISDLLKSYGYTKITYFRNRTEQETLTLPPEAP